MIAAGSRIAASLLALVVLAGCGDGRGGDSADADDDAAIVYGRGRQIAVLANDEITESSGIAASRLADGVLWTHNDSGDSPRVFAVDLAGEHLATLHLAGSANRDWEDMASFTLAGTSYLLLADVGDNAAQFDRCTLYFVDEPAIDAAARGVAIHAAPVATVTFVYADGPRDCESVAVVAGDGRAGRAVTVYLVNKRGRSPRTVYRLEIADLPAADGAAPLTAEPIAEVAMAEPTAMDISPDGRRAVLMTYLHGVGFTRRDGQTWADTFASPGRAIPLPVRKQGEAICFGRDGRTLYLTSEKLPTPLLEVPVVSPAERPVAGPSD